METLHAIEVEGVSIAVHTYNTVIVGTGAAGYCAALRLHQLGQSDIAIVTEGRTMGTSRNTGSDKQTYYKMTLCGDVPDSPMDMARDLFAGKCVDGDIALAEAALSVRAFMFLCDLGVPFPTNRYGEYIGYKTDHDPRARATSVGPLTSKKMTECLEMAVMDAKIPIYDGHQAIEILQEDHGACGILTCNKRAGSDEDARFCAFLARNVLYAPGGPAGIYADTVYPLGHSGASGIAFEAGVQGRNLTEWQYGLASLQPRWNVSGTYMQVLPRFVSMDTDGKEHFFLEEYYPNESACLANVFRKGYEWPFDCRKAVDGSSVIDLLVYREMFLHSRRVFIDFSQNPYGRTPDYDHLPEDAREYLKKNSACFGTPIERLRHMNEPAYALYLDKGVDLATQRLEIALCAQHNNGGLDIDAWWQTNLAGFFAVGEVAGSHGVYRPGGSALNAGQVGALRAAQYIAAHRTGTPSMPQQEMNTVREAAARHIALTRRLLSNPEKNISSIHQEITHRMSDAGAALREPSAMEAMLSTLRDYDKSFEQTAGATADTLAAAYRLRDTLIAQQVYLSAMLDYVRHGGASRGSAIYPSTAGQKADGLEDRFRFTLDDGSHDSQIQIVRYHDGVIDSQWRDVRPLPNSSAEGPFDAVWRAFRENGNAW